MRRFWSNQKGSMIVMFAVALIPILALMGAAIDYSRASLARTKMQAALDATGLFLSRLPGSTTQEDLNAKATVFFFANYTETDVLDILLTITPAATPGKLNLSAYGIYHPILVNVAGVTSFPVGTMTQVKWGNTRLRVSLVLDTTGSMSSAGKIDALKTAAKNLIDQLKDVASVPEDVYISIVPFVKDVNIGLLSTNYTASGIDPTTDNWLGFTWWKQEPPYMVNIWKAANATTWKRAGPGSACPWGSNTSATGFRCYDRPATYSGTTAASTVPASGTYAGLICPGPADAGNKISYMAGIYYNGCYTSVQALTTWTVASGSSASCGSIPSPSWCNCTGSGSSKVCRAFEANHYWRGANPTEPSPATAANPDPTATLALGGWNGCLTDRDQNYDTLNTAPSAGMPATLFKAEQYQYCNPTTSTGVMPMMGLSNNWTALKAMIDTLQPNGNTNQGIGIMMGWQTLTAAPFAVPAYTANYTYKKIVILMSDGLNTQNRYSTTASAIDTREASTCANVKADGTIIYAIQVNTGGDPTSTVLRNCATDSSKFFMLTSASQMVTTFQQIGTELSNLHLSQ